MPVLAPQKSAQAASEVEGKPERTQRVPMEDRGLADLANAIPFAEVRSEVRAVLRDDRGGTTQADIEGLFIGSAAIGLDAIASLARLAKSHPEATQQAHEIANCLDVHLSNLETLTPAQSRLFSNFVVAHVLNQVQDDLNVVVTGEHILEAAREYAGSLSAASSAQRESNFLKYTGSEE